MSGTDLSLVHDPAAMERLIPEWDALWHRADGRFAESALAGRLAWSRVAEPGGGRLALLVGRRAGELVMLMPMVLRRRGPLRLLRPLGPGAADYTALLLDPRCRSDADAILEAAWRVLARSAGADVVQLPSLPTASALQVLAARQPGTRVTGSDVLPLARPAAGETFEQYAAGLGKLSHYRPGGLRRRLAKTGDLRVLVPEPDDPVLPELVDWLLSRKQEWAQRAGKVGPWLFDPTYRAYLVDALAPGPDGADPVARLLVVRLDGAPVAASVLGLGASLVEGLVNGYAPEFSRYSPGLILTEACIEWAFGQGMGVDMGVGSEEYKQYWSRGDVRELVNLQVPLSVRGRLAMNAHGLARRAAARTGS